MRKITSLLAVSLPAVSCALCAVASTAHAGFIITSTATTATLAEPPGYSPLNGTSGEQV